MNELVLTLGWIGIYSPVALGAIGSAIGCAIAAKKYNEWQGLACYSLYFLAAIAQS